jgi:hypothetical protein
MDKTDNHTSWSDHTVVANRYRGGTTQGRNVVTADTPAWGPLIVRHGTCGDGAPAGTPRSIAMAGCTGRPNNAGVAHLDVSDPR